MVMCYWSCGIGELTSMGAMLCKVVVVMRTYASASLLPLTKVTI